MIFKNCKGKSSQILEVNELFMALDHWTITRSRVMPRGPRFQAVRIDEELPQVSMRRSWSDGDLAQLCEVGGFLFNICGCDDFPAKLDDLTETWINFVCS